MRFFARSFCLLSALMGGLAFPGLVSGADKPAVPAPTPAAEAPAVSPSPAAAPADPSLPSGSFPPSRYEVLWTKSPFQVASPDEAPSSPDYELQGIFKIDGVSYASVFIKQSSEHFVISSEQPVKGLTLVSVTPKHDSTPAAANLLKDGEAISLKMDSGMAVGGAPSPSMPMPGMNPYANAGVPPQMGRPPGMFQPSPYAGANGQPVPRFNRRTIPIPPPPPGQQVPAPQQGAPQPAAAQSGTPPPATPQNSRTPFP